MASRGVGRNGEPAIGGASTLVATFVFERVIGPFGDDSIGTSTLECFLRADIAKAGLATFQETNELVDVRGMLSFRYARPGYATWNSTLASHDEVWRQQSVASVDNMASSR